MLPERLRLLQVEDEAPPLPGGDPGNVGRQTVLLQEVPQDSDNGGGQGDGVGAPALGPGEEAVALDQGTELGGPAPSLDYVVKLLL